MEWDTESQLQTLEDERGASFCMWNAEHSTAAYVLLFKIITLVFCRRGVRSPSECPRREIQRPIGRAYWPRSTTAINISQEEFLCEWILEEEARGYPHSHSRTREMATRIRSTNHDEKSLGQKWVTHFISRNPRVATIAGRRIEASRIIILLPNVFKPF